VSNTLVVRKEKHQHQAWGIKQKIVSKRRCMRWEHESFLTSNSINTRKEPHLIWLSIDLTLLLHLSLSLWQPLTELLSNPTCAARQGSLLTLLIIKTRRDCNPTYKILFIRIIYILFIFYLIYIFFNLNYILFL
jgi:hypothetical protein